MGPLGQPHRPCHHRPAHHRAGALLDPRRHARHSQPPQLHPQPPPRNRRGSGKLAMATDRIIGIDLGTTNSLVAYMENDRPVVIPGEDGLNLVPSVVALDARDQIIVGNPARKYLIETPERAVYS